MKTKLRKSVVTGGCLLAAFLVWYGLIRPRPKRGFSVPPTRVAQRSATAQLQAEDALKSETFLMLSHETAWAERARFATRFAAFTNVSMPDTTVEPREIHVICQPTVDVSDPAYQPPGYYRIGLIDNRAHPDFDIPPVNENH